MRNAEAELEKYHTLEKGGEGGFFHAIGFTQ